MLGGEVPIFNASRVNGDRVWFMEMKIGHWSASRILAGETYKWIENKNFRHGLICEETTEHG
jgi:hypothetical protein